jgi:hypothetical protein
VSLFDFFFPEQAQAVHLRRLADAARRKPRSASTGAKAHDKRIADLEDDVGFLALILATLLQKVEEKGLVSRDEVRAALAELDDQDGVRNGKLDVEVLRGMGR